MIGSDSKSFNLTIQNTLGKTLFMHSTIWISLATTINKTREGKRWRNIHTCWYLSFLSPSTKDGGSHSRSRSTFMNSSMVSPLVGVSPNSTSLRGRRTNGKQVTLSASSLGLLESDPLQTFSQQPKFKNFSCKKTVLTDLFLRVCSHTLTTPTISLVVRRNSCIRAATRRAEDGKEAQWGHIRGYLYWI